MAPPVTAVLFAKGLGVTIAGPMTAPPWPGPVTEVEEKGLSVRALPGSPASAPPHCGVLFANVECVAGIVPPYARIAPPLFVAVLAVNAEFATVTSPPLKLPTLIAPPLTAEL